MKTASLQASHKFILAVVTTSQVTRSWVALAVTVVEVIAVAVETTVETGTAVTTNLHIAEYVVQGYPQFRQVNVHLDASKRHATLPDYTLHLSRDDAKTFFDMMHKLHPAISSSFQTLK